MYGLTLATLDDGRKAVIIRTSDRIQFKKCRRAWGFSSHLKMNLSPKALAAPLWFGSAVHYALEDYHGHNIFGHPRDAFRAYCISTAQNWKRDLPSDAQEHYELGKDMMDYYVDYWLKQYPRKADQTYWAPNPITGELEPQVEVNFEIPIPITPENSPLLHQLMVACGADVVLYRGTIDRVSIDEYGNLWVVEYKTAKQYMATHLPTDPQVTTYVWACSLIYDLPVVGVVYQQFIKKSPSQPRILTSGTISTAMNQNTSYPLYKEALTSLYGSVQKAPSLNQAYMNKLMSSETDDKDRYIIRERVNRNPDQCYHEAQKILLELEDMLNPNLPLYPNPTRDCSRMCSFVTACINMDDGSDWEGLLQQQYMPRDTEIDRLWRSRLPEAKKLHSLTEQGIEPNMEGIQKQSLEAYKQASIAAGEYELAEWEVKADPFEGMDEKGRFNMNEVES